MGIVMERRAKDGQCVSSRVGANGLRRVQEMPVANDLAIGSELPQVNLLVLESLARRPDGEIHLDQYRDMVPRPRGTHAG